MPLSPQPPTPAWDARRVRIGDGDLEVIQWTEHHAHIRGESFDAHLNPLDDEALKNFRDAYSRLNSSATGRTVQEVEADGIQFDCLLVNHQKLLASIRSLATVPDGGLAIDFMQRDFSVGIDWDEAHRFLTAVSVSDEVNMSATVLSAEDRYAKQRQPGMPWRKFDLYMDPAPICVGDLSHSLKINLPTKAHFAAGGRQLADDTFEFYARNDPISVRVDLWLTQEPPSVENVEAVFSAPIRVGKVPVTLWSFDQEYELDIPEGHYDAEVRVVNLGQSRAQGATSQEVFDDSAVERYEIILRRQN